MVTASSCSFIHGKQEAAETAANQPFKAEQASEMTHAFNESETAWKGRAGLGMGCQVAYRCPATDGRLKQIK